MLFIKDQGKKQVDDLQSLKAKEQTKPIEDKSNNWSKASVIFDDLINKRKEIMSELHGGVDYNNLKFEYIGPTKDVSFMNTWILKSFSKQWNIIRLNLMR